MTWMAQVCRRARPLAAVLLLLPSLAMAQGEPAHAGGEANLVVPDLTSQQFLGMSGRSLLMSGLVVCALGLLFGLVMYSQLRNMRVHEAMREMSELIYETCKTYLVQQGKFLAVLWIFIGAVTAVYFGTLASTVDAA